jgi:uncharacterized membrane protein
MDFSLLSTVSCVFIFILFYFFVKLFFFDWVLAIVALIPTTIDGIEDQFSGVDPLADSVGM